MAAIRSAAPGTSARGHTETRVSSGSSVTTAAISDRSAASAGVPLVTHGQRLAILPAVYGIDDLSEAIASYDTIVLMKVNRTLLHALANLEQLGLAGKGIYVRRASTAQEEVVRDRTGRGTEEWNAILDIWAAGHVPPGPGQDAVGTWVKAKGHTLAAKVLLQEHGVSPWWAQAVTIRYEYERGLRE